MTREEFLCIVGQEGCRVFLVEFGRRTPHPKDRQVVFPIALPAAPLTEYRDVSLTADLLNALTPDRARSLILECKAELLAEAVDRSEKNTCLSL